MKLPSARTLTQCFDSAGRPKSVTGTKAGESARTYVSQATYDAGGGVDQMGLGNGKWEDWEYNERKQVTGVKLGSTLGGGDLLTLGYNFGASATNNGNVLSQSISRPSAGFAVTQSYDYDDVNRISSISEGSDFRTFVHSATDNMWVTTASPGWAPGSFTPRTPDWYNNKNQLVNVTLGIQYDGAGNQTVIGAYTFTYDAENRLKTATLGGSTTAYAYDGDGRRVKKGSPVMVYDAFGNLAAEYGGTATGTQYLTVDPLGSIRAVANDAGAVQQCHDYLPYGEELTQGTGGRPACYAATTEPRQRFTGKERDAESGLDYFGARYMSPAQGRFTSPHPLVWQSWQNGDEDEQARFREFISNPQNLNLYTYGMNNPLKYNDPTGLDVEVAITFVGDVSDEEKKRIIGAVTSYYQTLKVGNVVVRDTADASQDKRTFGQKVKDLFTKDYQSITVDLAHPNPFGNNADRPDFV